MWVDWKDFEELSFYGGFSLDLVLKRSKNVDMKNTEFQKIDTKNIENWFFFIFGVIWIDKLTFDDLGSIFWFRTSFVYSTHSQN